MSVGSTVDGATVHGRVMGDATTDRTGGSLQPYFRSVRNNYELVEDENTYWRFLSAPQAEPLSAES